MGDSDDDNGPKKCGSQMSTFFYFLDFCTKLFYYYIYSIYTMKYEIGGMDCGDSENGPKQHKTHRLGPG